MSKARDLANAGTALGAVTATELGYVDGVTSAIQTQIDTKLATATAATTYQAINANVSTTELGYLDGVTSAIQTQLDAKEATLPSQTGNSGKYLTTNGTAKSWGTVSQYALPSQTGNSGKFLTTNGTAESWGTSGVTWTNRLTGVSAGFNQIAYNGTNLWVAVGNSGTLYSSPDAVTWTSRTSQFGSDNINDIFFGNGLWVAVGGTGKISTSTDGTTWTARTANMSTNPIYAVTYANSLWVAVGAGGGTTNTGGITYSTDGTTWTRKSQSVAVGTTYNDIIWNGTNWVIGAESNGTNNFLYATAPSGTWTVGQFASNSGAALRTLIYDGTRTIIIDMGGSGNAVTYYSTSTTLASPTSYSSVPSLNAGNKGRYKLYSGSIYVIGTYISKFTPASSQYGTTQDVPILTPVSNQQYEGNSTLVALIASSPIVWVGAQGYIVAATGYGIYTSF